MELKIRVKKARNYAGLTQAELADRAKVKQQTISRLENGITKTSPELLDIAIACGVRPEWLKNGTGDMLPTITTGSGGPSFSGSADSELLVGDIDQDIVDAVAMLMGSGVSLNTRNTLTNIAQKAKDGKLTEEDVLLLGQIADKIEKK